MFSFHSKGICDDLLHHLLNIDLGEKGVFFFFGSVLENNIYKLSTITF